LDAEALRSLFDFPSESKVEDEKETDDTEQFIKTSEGKDVRVVTTKQKNREQSPKVAENDTTKLGIPGNGKREGKK
jgi:hypothetical protein